MPTRSTRSRWITGTRWSTRTGWRPIPSLIDAIVYQNVNLYNVRPAKIEGHCIGMGSGLVRVGLHVGKCHGFGTFDAYTGWISVSRIIIEEVEPPVA